MKTTVSSGGKRIRTTYGRLKQKDYDRKRKYGLDPGQYKLLVAQQNGMCAACGGPPMGHWHVLVVDHCHDSKIVRGLLCNDCNVVLGRVKDSAPRLEALARYVRKFDWLKQ